VEPANAHHVEVDSEENPMPYALFENDDKLSRAFPTEADVWLHADEAGLMTETPAGKRVLEDHYTIRPCPPDPIRDSEPASD
jgi:hypothetical protein